MEKLLMKLGQWVLICTPLYCSLVVIVIGRCSISPYVDDCNNTGYLWNCSSLQLNSVPKFPPELKNQNVTLDLSFNIFSILNNETFQEVSNHFDVTMILLHHNNLSKVGKNVFHMLSSLCSLDLSYCSLDKNRTDIHAFDNTPKLKRLQIHQNNFHQTGYPDVSISKIQSLEFLKIDLFDGFIFSEAFENLTNLSKLEFNCMTRFSLTNHSFYGLKHSPISNLLMNFRHCVNCHVTEDLFDSFPNLTGNLLMNFGGNCNVTVALRSLKCLQYRNILSINLNENKKSKFTDMTILNDWSMKYLINICVRKLSLWKSGIYSVETILVNTILWHCLEYFDISENNLHTVDLSTVTAIWTLPKIRHFNVCCNDPPSMLVAFQHVYNRTILPKNIFLNITLPDTLEVVDYSKNYIHIGVRRRLSVACSAKELQELYIKNTNFPLESVSHSRLPSLYKIDVSRNSFDRVKSDIFRNSSNLREIYAVDVNLDFAAIPNSQNLFQNLTKLSLLDISQNNLAALPPTLFIDQKHSLTKINMNYNRFTVLPHSILILQKLQVLFLQNNLIPYFSRNSQLFFQSMHNLSIYLEGNPISCVCSHHQSLRWMKNHQDLFVDLHFVLCTESKTPITELFHRDKWRKFALDCQANDWLIVASVLLCLTLLLLVILGFVKRYRTHLEYVILRIKNRWKGVHLLKQGTAFIHTFLYDVYVSYSDDDYNWIIQNLYPKLESLSMRAWLKDKDSIPGVWEAEEIVKCINDSRKILFVVSESFLDKGWSSYAVQMAVTHSFHNQRQGSIVVIIKGDVHLDQLPNDIKNIWWCIEYFRWTECEDDEEIQNKISNMLKSV